MIKTPPLPFPGTKKNFKNEFLAELKERFDDTYTFVDLFGGSGYLSYMTKYTFPDARVIYNDYDHYVDRLTHVDQLNELVNRIKVIFKKYKVPPVGKAPMECKAEIREMLKKAAEEEDMYVDYLTLSTVLCFTNCVCLCDEDFDRYWFYNRINKKPYSVDDSYLEGLEIVNMDYRDLYEKYKDKDNVVFFIDPPYLASDCRSFRMGLWRLDDYLNVLPILKEQKHWMYFTNDYAYICQLLSFIDKELTSQLKELNVDQKPKLYLEGVKQIERKAHVGYNKNYTDMLMAKGGKTEHNG